MEWYFVIHASSCYILCLFLQHSNHVLKSTKKEMKTRSFSWRFSTLNFKFSLFWKICVRSFLWERSAELEEFLTLFAFHVKYLLFENESRKHVLCFIYRFFFWFVGKELFLVLILRWFLGKKEYYCRHGF